MNFSNSKIRSTALNNLQKNAYFAHGKNILLNMLADDDKSIRERAVDKVLQTRQYEYNSGRTDENMPSSAHTPKVSSFEVPKIDFNEQSHDTLISINEECMTEPLLRLQFPYNKTKNI